MPDLLGYCDNQLIVYVSGVRTGSSVQEAAEGRGRQQYIGVLASRRKRLELCFRIYSLRWAAWMSRIWGFASEI